MIFIYIGGYQSGIEIVRWHKIIRRKVGKGHERDRSEPGGIHVRLHKRNGASQPVSHSRAPGVESGRDSYAARKEIFFTFSVHGKEAMRMEFAVQIRTHDCLEAIDGIGSRLVRAREVDWNGVQRSIWFVTGKFTGFHVR